MTSVREDGQHADTLYVCFPKMPQSYPLQVFLPMSYTTTFVG